MRYILESTIESAEAQNFRQSVLKLFNPSEASDSIALKFKVISMHHLFVHI